MLRLMTRAIRYVRMDVWKGGPIIMEEKLRFCRIKKIFVFTKYRVRYKFVPVWGKALTPTRTLNFTHLTVQHQVQLLTSQIDSYIREFSRIDAYKD